MSAQPGQPVTGPDRARAAYAVSRFTAILDTATDTATHVLVPPSVVRGALDALAYVGRDEAAERGRSFRLERHYRDLLRVHAQVVMDTDEDRALHRRAVATFHRALRLYRNPPTQEPRA